MFSFGLIISDVTKVTLFHVIEANKAPTILIKTTLKVSKFKTGLNSGVIKFNLIISKLNPQNIPQTIIATIDKTFVIVKMFWVIIPALTPRAFIKVINKTASMAKICWVDYW